MPPERSRTPSINLTTAVQALSTSPDSQSARIGVVNAAQALAQQLNATTQGIQSLRANAETGINDSVNMANNAMKQIALINNQLQNNGRTDASTASLLDQRDAVYRSAVATDGHPRRHQQHRPGDRVHQFRRAAGRHRSGEAVVQSAGHGDAEHAVRSGSAKNNVGTITIDFPHGGSYDLVATNAIRSGKLAAYLELRDNSLVQAQAQIDQFAASMSSALSDQTTAGVAAPASVLPQAGFDLDLSGLQNRQRRRTSPTRTTSTGITHNLSIVRVDDPSRAAAGQQRHARSER